MGCYASSQDMGTHAGDSVRSGSTTNAALAFMSDGGRSGELMRSIDWSATVLGDADQWPTSLKTTIGILLRSRHPMFLWWGPDLIQFYNDAYTPSFGVGKHPAAMGQRGSDCWQEIWPIIWPQIDDVMNRGIASWNEDQLVPIFRNGRIEEVYWTYGYSPVLTDDGTIGGTLVVCTETTNRVLAMRRIESLRVCSDAAANATDLLEILSRVEGALARSANDLAFALIYVTDPGSQAIALDRKVGVSQAAADSLHAAFGARLADLASRGRPVPLPPGLDITSSIWPEPVAEAYVVPIAVGGLTPVGYLVAGISPRLPFDAAYGQYLRQLAELLAQGFARIEAFRIRALVEGERNQLLEQAPVATALVTGPRHVFRLANPLFRQIVGRKEIVGHEYLEVFPEMSDTAMPAILDRVYQTGEPFVTNEMLVPLDRTGSGAPEDCYFKFNLEPIRNEAGEIDGMMAVAVDITPQVLARKDLERGQAEREELLKDLRSANRTKDEFLAMLGHELRNPLSPILTALQLMKLRGIKEADRERAIIERQVRHVVGLVDDLLDVSRITRGQIELKRDRVAVAEFVAKAIEQASPLIESRGHRLSVDVSPLLFVDGDAGRLAQVVANLLTNAAKYTEPGGDISVTAVEQDRQLELQVADTGTGIAPETLPHVLEAFTQERQRADRSTGGLGLGLAIVKNLVEAHQGTVEILSPGRGHGTTAVVRVPIAFGDRGAASAPADQRRHSGHTGSRILLVDDNQDAALLLSESLGALGHDVKVAFDASAALMLGAVFVPDIALLDLGLPVVDGHELAEQLRGLDGWQHVRFVALTGYGQRHDRERSRDAGFDAHLVKPVDVGDVDVAIRAFSPRTSATPD